MPPVGDKEAPRRSFKEGMPRSHTSRWPPHRGRAVAHLTERINQHAKTLLNGSVGAQQHFLEFLAEDRYTS